MILIALAVLYAIYQIAYNYYWKHHVSPRFDGKVIFITGASSGIGEELAKQLCVLGPKKLVLAARRVSELNRVRDECLALLAKKGIQDVVIDVQSLDLIDPHACKAFAEKYAAENEVDILINNGGISQRESFATSDFALLEKLMKVNTMSPIALISGFMPRFIKNKGDSQIVNVLSVAGLVGAPVRTFYSASKFALDGFGKALQGEIHHHGIHVMQVYPAYVQTNISKNALTGGGTPLGKTDTNIENGVPVDIAVSDMIKGMFLKRQWLILGGTFFQLSPKIALANEWFSRFFFAKNYRQQMKAISEAAEK